MAENDPSRGCKPQGLYYEPHGAILRATGALLGATGAVWWARGPPSRQVKLTKKVIHFVYVLPTKVAPDGPGLTRERRDDDYSP